jgi:hypothetical protein
MASIITLANTAAIVANTSVNSYTFVNCTTNQFRITSNLAVTADTAFVAVFLGSQPVNMDHPTLNGTTGVGVPVVGGESIILQGNFGTSNLPANVTIGAICSTGAAGIYITPVYSQS